MKTLRWGIVGTGGIANSMAGMIKMADAAEIGAVSSRRIESAQEFAQQHDVPNAFDSWQEMIDSDTVDAVYVATPTSVREEICIAAANGQKHVLADKVIAHYDGELKGLRLAVWGLAFQPETVFGRRDELLDGVERGELLNLGAETFEFQRGQRIAQLLVLDVPDLHLVESASLPPAPDDRGGDGFGSSG